ncbi:MAG: phosphotransferase [Solirubrobacteraceae bacterium]
MEERLRGGNLTGAVRIGDSVRRSAGPWTETVHELLRHVRARGVLSVPEPRGRDEQGREVVGFVEGEVPAYPMPEYVWGAALLTDAARLLRAFHDASADFSRAGRTWRLPAHEPDEVICHNDFAPYNLVFRGGRLAGAIDFDVASPGPRVWDLAYLAYRLVPLAARSNPDAIATGEAARALRLRALCAAYGEPAPASVLDTVPLRLDELAALSEDREAVRAHAALYRADAAYVRERREALLA